MTKINMLKYFSLWFWSFVFICCSALSFAVAENQSGVEPQLILDRENINPSRSGKQAAAQVGIYLKIAEGWHTYWKNSGEAALPITVKWILPEGLEIGEFAWPAPLKFKERGGVFTYGYKDEVLLSAPLFVADLPEAARGKPLVIRAELSWLACQDICIPAKASLSKQIVPGSQKEDRPTEFAALFERYRTLRPLKLDELKSSAIALELWREEDSSAALRISGLKQTELSSAAKSIQIFPEAVSGVQFEPFSLTSDPSGDYLALFNLSGDLSKPLNKLSGTLLLSEAITADSKALNLSWSLPLKQSKHGLDSAERIPLSYRFLDLEQAETKEEPKSLPLKKTDLHVTELLINLALAFIAGLILNLMPCVLPVLCIKVLGFLNQTQQDRSQVRSAAFSYTLGVLFSFLLLALLSLSLKRAGASLGWGFQFQHPEFVLALLLVVFCLSLALFDFFNINLPFMQSAVRASGSVQHPLLRHFLDGILATALSTPCTAPILGTALVFAFSQAEWVSVLVFLSIGLGLATPYVYCATHPGLLRFVPQPGIWMLHFRQILGFFLLATCAWLLYVLDELTEKGGFWAVCFMLLLFFLLWLRKVRLESYPDIRTLWARLFSGFLLSAVLSGAYYFYPKLLQPQGAPSKSQIAWEEFSEERVRETLASGQGVFIEFTASWCITCKFNEFRLIETPQTAAILKENNVVPFKADWTKGDEQITQALKRYGAEGVPLYVILRPSQSPIVLSTLPSRESLWDALRAAK